MVCPAKYVRLEDAYIDVSNKAHLFDIMDVPRRNLGDKEDHWSSCDPLLIYGWSMVKSYMLEVENSFFVSGHYFVAMETHISSADLKQERLQKDNG